MDAFNNNNHQQPPLHGSMDGQTMEQQSHMPPLQGAMDGNNGMQQQPQQPVGIVSRCGNCMKAVSLDTYRQYFDIDADDIVQRMKSAMLDFYKPEYFRNEVMGVHKTDTLKGPDLYGPFWITMTLIFFVAATSNMHAYLRADDIEEFDYDINHLLHASSTMLAMAFLVPTIFWVTTQCLAMNALQLAEWVCIYGYSLVPFLPAVILCIIPLSIMPYIALLGATCMSGGLIVRNVTPALMSSGSGAAQAPSISIAILVCHGIFLVVMKFRFYHKR